MKRLILMLIVQALASASLPAIAGERGPGDREQKMVEELKLNDEQAAAVRDIMQEQRGKWHALRQQEGLDRDAMKARMEAIHAEGRERLAKVLTPEQLAKFDEHAESRRAHWQDRKGRGMEERLNLSDEQSGTVRTIMEEQRQKREAILSSDASRDDKRAQMKTLEEETHTRLSGVLNEEQLKQMQDMHRHRHDRPHKGERGERKQRAGEGQRDTE